MRQKGQSTAEYAILMGIVVAVAAGIMGGLLRTGMSTKQRQAMGVLDAAGDNLGEGVGFNLSDKEARPRSYTQEVRRTRVLGGDRFRDVEVLHKGGAVEKVQNQTTQTESITIEGLDEVTVPAVPGE